MFFSNPIAQIISLASALAYAAQLSGRRALGRSLLFLLPVVAVAAIVNPAFNHQGATTLVYLPTGNPLTLESILYGIYAALLLASVIIWFQCYTEVMTSDKFIYLFGRVIPALSLVLSMTLRFVPKFKAQMQAVTEAQRCVGRDVSEGSVWRRAKTAVTILSILVTWALENAIETADSMKSRGYGLPGRTAFSIYRFDSRDRLALLWLGFCGFFICSGWMAKGFYWRYYPTVKGGPVTPLTTLFFLGYLTLCLTPVVLDRWEDRAWKRLARNMEAGSCGI